MSNNMPQQHQLPSQKSLPLLLCVCLLGHTAGIAHLLFAGAEGLAAHVLCALLEAALHQVVVHLQAVCTWGSRAEPHAMRLARPGGNAAGCMRSLTCLALAYAPASPPALADGHRAGLLRSPEGSSWWGRVQGSWVEPSTRARQRSLPHTSTLAIPHALPCADVGPRYPVEAIGTLADMEAALAALQQGMAELVAVLRANPGLLPSALAISAIAFLSVYIVWWLLSDLLGTLAIPTIVVPTTACKRSCRLPHLPPAASFPDHADDTALSCCRSQWRRRRSSTRPSLTQASLQTPMWCPAMTQPPCSCWAMCPPCPQWRCVFLAPPVCLPEPACQLLLFDLH